MELDGLALTGKAPIIRRWPMIPGIDLAGTVLLRHPGLRGGDAVILNGWEAGVSHYGGYAQVARVDGDWLVKSPAAVSAAEPWRSGPPATRPRCACLRWSATGLATPASGPVVVTRAAGGVGSVAVAMLAELGYQVVASTGPPPARPPTCWTWGRRR